MSHFTGPAFTTPPASSGAGLFISALVHGVLIATVMISPSAEERAARFDSIVPEGLTFLVPPSASPAAPYVALHHRPSGGDEGNIRDEARSAEGQLRSGGTGDSDASPDASASVNAVVATSSGGSEHYAETFEVIDVDSAAVRDPSSAAPAYPAALMRAGVEGWAAVRFVVDSTGRVDLGTVESLGFTAPAFHHAVQEALPRMRFRPAMIGDRAVRQLAEQLFKFELQRADTLSMASAAAPDSACVPFRHER